MTAQDRRAENYAYRHASMGLRVVENVLREVAELHLEHKSIRNSLEEHNNQRPSVSGADHVYESVTEMLVQLDEHDKWEAKRKEFVEKLEAIERKITSKSERLSKLMPFGKAVKVSALGADHVLEMAEHWDTGAPYIRYMQQFTNAANNKAAAVRS